MYARNGWNGKTNPERQEGCVGGERNLRDRQQRSSNSIMVRGSKGSTMWIRTLLAMTVLLEIPALAAEKVTVAQLEQAVAQTQGEPDKDAARKIETLTLCERLARVRFEKLEAELPGPKARSALLILADASAFLDLPTADVPAIAPPTVDEQRAIVLRAVQFAANMAHKMPNFYATRDTTQYQSIEHAGKISVPEEPAKEPPKLELERTQPFQKVGRSLVTVLYRNGRELIENKHRNGFTPEYGVENRGEFGEMLGLVIPDMVRSQISWSHWEQGDADLLAVFRFEVPKDKAHYHWSFCCIQSSEGEKQVLRNLAAYQVEIAIEPKTGSILRIAIKTEPEHSRVLEASEVVEYGAVEIGGVSYICPLRNVVLYAVRMADNLPLSDSGAHSASLISIAINRTLFENYHLFRGDVRIVPDLPQPVPASEGEPKDNSGSQSQP